MTETASGSAGRPTNEVKKRGSEHGVITRGGALGGVLSGRKNSATERGFESQAGAAHWIEESRELAGCPNANGKIGLAAFLHAKKVPGVENASYTCG